jgi:hypothetical protein
VARYHVHSRNRNRVEVNTGLNGRVLAYAEEDVILDDGTNVGMKFHRYADGGQVFPKEDGTGYYYLSNDEDGSYPESGYKPGLDRSKYGEYLTGGVYRLEFTNEHEVRFHYLSRITRCNDRVDCCLND